jgi:hypothetical protein
MRLNKEELKSIVKECLVEILTEPALNESRSLRQQIQPRQQVQPKQSTQSIDPGLARRRAHLESIQVNQGQQQAAQDRARVTKSEIGSITSDPILQSIFADTAQRLTEAPEPSAKGGRITHEQAVMSSGDTASKAMLNADPLDIFDSASKWADLAFSEPVRRV